MIDMQKHFANSWRMFSDQPLFLIGGGVFAQVMNLATLGVLSGPIIGAYLLCLVVYFRDGKEPEFAELFSGFQRLWDLLPYAVIAIITIVGFFFFVIPGLLFMTWWLYVLLLMVDQKMPMSTAMATSRSKVQESGFFTHLLFIIMITVLPALVINGLSLFLPLIKAVQIVVMPFQCACLASLYLEQFEGTCRLQQE